MWCIVNCFFTFNQSEHSKDKILKKIVMPTMDSFVRNLLKNLVHDINSDANAQTAHFFKYSIYHRLYLVLNLFEVVLILSGRRWILNPYI